MTGISTIAGRGTHEDRPNWVPLLDLVGPVLVRWFMWMGELALADGATVQAYKHVATRRYLHLATSRRALVYVGRDRYREIEVDEALEDVFFEWEELCPGPDLASRIAYEKLMRRVSR